MLNTNVWARHSVEKNVDFMQNMSCSLPSPEAIHAARFMQRIHAEYRHASCVMQITHTPKTCCHPHDENKKRSI